MNKEKFASLVVLAATVVIVSLLVGYLDAKRERDAFEANEIAVSQAYSKHLYVEYRRVMCGVDEAYDNDAFPQTRLLTEKQRNCVFGAKQKAVNKVGEATRK